MEGVRGIDKSTKGTQFWSMTKDRFGNAQRPSVLRVLDSWPVTCRDLGFKKQTFSQDFR
jgi:hypothetical protein